MSSITDQNKKITREFFKSLSTGSDKYLDFYTNDSIIWTAGNNAIGGTRTKKEVVNFAKNILENNNLDLNYTNITTDTDIAKISVV